jgi:hypothetical protein
MTKLFDNIDKKYKTIAYLSIVLLLNSQSIFFYGRLFYNRRPYPMYFYKDLYNYN